jgi:hypothetical protein
VQIVEKQSDETLRRQGGGRRRSYGSSGRWGGRRSLSLHRFGLCFGNLNGKAGDFLRLAVVEQPEVFFVKIADRLPFRVAHHHSHYHQVALDSYPEWGCSLLRLYLRRVGALWGSARAEGQHQGRQRDSPKKASARAAHTHTLRCSNHKSSFKTKLGLAL